MKSKLTSLRRTALLLLLLTLNLQLSTLFGQDSAFTYQGRLTDGTNPVSGSFDFRFALFTGPVLPVSAASPITNNSVLVSEGLFVTQLDFGTNAFTGGSRWLEISVRSNGVGAFGVVSPRQQITSTPYAIRAANFSGAVSASQLPAGVVTNGATNIVLGGTFNGSFNGPHSGSSTGAHTGTFSGSHTGAFTGTFVGNGGGLTNLNVTLGGMTAADFWQLDGNAVSPNQVLGSTNNQAIEFVVNGFTALRLEPNAMASPNFLGGRNHLITPGVYAATIGGGSGHTIAIGSDHATIGGGQGNNIESNSYSATISGGANNRVRVSSPNGVMAGGESNIIETNSTHAVIGGGLQNSLRGNNAFSAIVGGNANTHTVSSGYGFIGGGRNNTNSASAAGTIGGGEFNSIQTGADRAVIAGGLQNVVTGAGGMVLGGIANSAGQNAFAAGRRAKANHLGSFVWTDNTSADVASTANNQVTMRASGGYRFFSESTATVGAALAAGGNAWAPTSDRNVKENFAPVDCRALLAKVVALPVTTWNLKTQPTEIRHIGVMAQDFQAAFAVGEDDRHISTSDADGVALAAIQGLNQKVEDRSQKSEVKSRELEEKLKQKETEIAELKQRLDALEKMVRESK